MRITHDKGPELTRIRHAAVTVLESRLDSAPDKGHVDLYQAVCSGDDNVVITQDIYRNRTIERASPPVDRAAMLKG